MSVTYKMTSDAPAPMGDRTYAFTISTAARDRDNDRIAVDGWDTKGYLANPVVMFGHDYKSLPVARTVGLRQEGDRLVAQAQFPPSGTYQFADEVHGLVREGFLTGASVGFTPGEFEPNDWGGKDFIRGHKLLEWSLVPIPSNPTAGRMPSGLSPKAQYDVQVKAFCKITDSRVARLVPHTRGLDVVQLKSWLKSDRHYSQGCPAEGCPNKGPQLPECPAGGRCPQWSAWALDMGPEYDPAAVRQAVLFATKDMARELVAPALRDALRRHRGRVD